MRVLHVSDIHCNYEGLRRVLKHEEYDIVFVTGDFECLEAVRVLEEAKTQVYAVTGNLDDPRIADLLEELGMSVENKVVEFEGFRIAGVSGQEPKTSVKLLMNKDFDVLLSHYPPKGFVDRAWSGVHIGLPEIRELCEMKKPLVIHTGHVHEARGVDKCGNTIVVNPGPLRYGYYAIVRYEEEIIVELKG